MVWDGRDLKDHVVPTPLPLDEVSEHLKRKNRELMTDRLETIRFYIVTLYNSIF